MKAETISMAFGRIDDDMIAAADALRSRKKKTPWKRWMALAACLCLVAGSAAVVLRGFPLLGAKCGGNPGVLAGGRYYYATDFALYRYIPATQAREYLMSKFFVRDWKADEHGVYFIRGLSLYVREHETGNTRKLYTADQETVTHLYFVDFSLSLTNRRVDIGLGNTRHTQDGLTRVVSIDSRTGDVIFHGEITGEEREALQHSGNLQYEYPIGSHVFRKALTEQTADGGRIYELRRDGQPFLAPPENANRWIELAYIGNNLLIRQQVFLRSADNDREYDGPIDTYLLAAPDGNIVTLPGGLYLTGTDDHLMYQSKPDSFPSAPILYSYDVKTGATELLYDGGELRVHVAEEVTTDGTWLFTTVPWGGTDCWKLIYDDAGHLTGLELYAANV